MPCSSSTSSISVLGFNIIYVAPPTASAAIATVATAITIGINSIAAVPVAKSATAAAVPNNTVAPPAEILLLSACCFSCFSSASFRSFFIKSRSAKFLGVLPSLFFNKGSAPFAMRILTISVWPFIAAQCKGVIPFASPASIFALTFAPFAMRIFTTSVWPFTAA